MDTLSWALWILCGLLALSVVMGVRGARIRIPAGTKLPNQLKPTLAAELARSREDVDRIVGSSESPEGRANRSVLRLQQYLDLPFIVGYVLLFFALGSFESTLAFAGASVLGLASRGSAVVAAVADLLEDRAILQAVNGREGSVRRFGLPKWLFIFLALIGQSVLFFFFPAPNHFQQGLALLIGIVFLIGGLGGVVSILLRRDAWIMQATKVFGLGLLLLLVLLCLHQFRA